MDPKLIGAGVIVVGLLILALFVYFSKKNKKTPNKVTYRQYNNSKVDITNTTYVDKYYLKSSVESQVFTIGMRVIIKNWYVNYNGWKLLGYHGPKVDLTKKKKKPKKTKETSETLCKEPSTPFTNKKNSENIWQAIDIQHPGIWFEPVVNNMRIVMNKEYVVVNNIPVGSWFQLYVTWNGKNVDVYIDGAIRVTKVFPKPVNITSNDFHFGGEFGTSATFKGSIQKFEYSNYVYNSPRIQNA